MSRIKSWYWENTRRGWCSISDNEILACSLTRSFRIRCSLFFRLDNDIWWRGRYVSKSVANGWRYSLEDLESFTSSSQVKQLASVEDERCRRWQRLTISAGPVKYYVCVLPLTRNIPTSLRVLQWEIDNSIVRYEFEPGQSVVRVVDPPEQRQWPDMLLWTDASILKHLQVRSWTPKVYWISLNFEYISCTLLLCFSSFLINVHQSCTFVVQPRFRIKVSLQCSP